MGLRDFFTRHVSKRVNVYRIDDFSVEPPEVVKMPKRVKTVSKKPEVSCKVSRPVNFSVLKEKMTVPAKRVKLKGNSAISKSVRFKKYVKEDIKVHHHSFSKKPDTTRMTKQIQALPQERENILKTMKNRPETAKGEVLLACFGPIVEGSVLKLVLNKQRGTLLVWYKSSSRQLKAKYVYLVRRFGAGGKPEWRWL